MLKKIVNLVNKLVPKKNIILFNSFPDISGNSLMLYRYMTEHQKEFISQYEIVWSINGNDISMAENILKKASDYKEYKVCRKKSVAGLWTYCQSKYIISTHNYITGLKTCGKQKHFNLWHGMPFKAIGKMLDNGGAGDVIQADYTLATSPLFQKIMSQAFGLDQNHVMITGQPCNDILFSESHALEKLGIDKRKYEKILIWMPTYRKSMVGSIREDGDADAFGVAEVFESHFEELTNLLREKKILLLIKPHPMDVICQMEVENSSYIKVFQNRHLDAAGVVLYELLAESDVLITDYSSVFIDYLNLGRPIAFVCDDLESYAANRGFCFDPIKEYLPGEKITNYTGLKEYLCNLDSLNDQWEKKREEINKLFNSFSDAHSSKRVFEFIFKEKR